MAFLSSIGKSGDVAERSPAVISANLKEDMILQKKIVVLNRSEHAVIHQIKVDQKVLYKRFQAKLVRSKLANARLLGQRDIQRELRAKNLGGLNTDIAGNSDEDYTFLKLLEKRPCTANSLSPRTKEPPKIRTPKRLKPEDSEVGTKSNGRSASARARYHRQLADDFEIDEVAKKGIPTSNEISDATTKQRPATSGGARVEKEFIQHQTTLKSANTAKRAPEKNIDLTKPDIETSKPDENGEVEVEIEADKYIEDENNHIDNNTESDDTSKSDENDNVNGDKQNEEPSGDHETITADVGQKDATEVENDADKKPNVAFLDELQNTLEGFETVDKLDIEDEPVTPISPSLLSRRASRGGSDFFTEEKKVDVISLRLHRVKSLDYTSDVQRFCEDLEELKGTMKQPSVDYYAMRLQLSEDKGVEKPMVEVPGTPEDENKRSVGNLLVRSLTVPEINWDFTSE